MYDVIIIGAGPAGLSAAIYLKRANKKVLILEAKSYGVQIVNAMDIENYPGYSHISGFAFATKLYQQVNELGVELKNEEVIEINNEKTKKVITKKNKYTTKSIIIATGCLNKKLGLDNEEELIGKGISYCATCDGNFYKGKTVAVVGGGNTAIDDVMFLSNICKKVYLIHRRDTFKVFERDIDILKNKDNVEFILNSNITKINGKDHIENVEINNKKYLNIEGLFIAIGQKPSTDIFKDIVNLNKDGYIKSKTGLTNCNGIFVAGDVREKDVRQLVTATSDGAIAAMEAIKYLNE